MNVKFKVLSLVIVLFAMNINAQNTERKWGLGFNFGNEQYNGEFGNGFFNFDQAMYGFAGISLGRNISEHLDVTLNASLGEVGFVENSNNRFRHSLFQANLNAQYNFFKYDDVKLRPFLHAGLGYMNFSDKRSDRKFNNMALPSLGAGISYKVSDAVSLILRETFLFLSKHTRESRIYGLP